MKDDCKCLDYPVSWDFYRWHCIEHHQFDPGDNNFLPEIREVIENKTFFLENVTDGQFLKLKAQFNTLSEKVNKIGLNKKGQYKEYDTNTSKEG